MTVHNGQWPDHPRPDGVYPPPASPGYPWTLPPAPFDIVLQGPGETAFLDV